MAWGPPPPVISHFMSDIYLFISFYVGKLVVYLHIRAPQFKKVSLGNEVGSKTDQNKPLRLGLRSFASKLMDLDGLKVSNFQPKI